ncbi:hypothetical protein [Bradyrhizobium sp. LHD-71]|uniref:hypothetical protein n=1 Tax=Bradyrhizobium sp. LHD-71 TaxID=3072141 RepID=UPI00280DCF4E|nr:hypothetical protein [Bradyrhizobium sp. LHD-71]MDQ8726247.1 hypothetical protein [Bradyrhizobium sp. LHD-71]
MIISRWKLATALGVAGAVILSIASADARSGRHPMNAYGADQAPVYGGGPYAYQPDGAGPYVYRPNGGPYAYQPSFGDSYNSSSSPSTGYFGSGTFSDGRRVPGTNFNPNQ